MTITLSPQDFDAILLQTDLGTSNDNTYVSFTSSLGTDYAGLSVEMISNTEATGAVAILPDNMSPQVESYTLDLNMGTLIIIFNEPINVSSIDYTGLVLLAGPNSPQTVQLTNGSVDGENTRNVVININSDDLNRIKSNPLLSQSAFTSLAVAQGAFVDIGGNDINEQPTSNPFTANPPVVFDTTPPEISLFDVRMDDNQLPLYVLLEFTEVVNSLSLNSSGLVLQSNASNSSIMYVLDDIMVTTSRNPTVIQSGDSEVIVLVINSVDDVRSLPPLAQTIDTTYIFAYSDFIDDVTGNSYESTGVPISVDTFTADLIQPTLIEFTFDLNKGIIYLNFSEPVLESSINASALLLLNNQSLAGPVFTPLNSTFYVVFEDSISIELSATELNHVKSITNLATERDDTYISMRESFITDMAENTALNIPPKEAHRVDTYIPDSLSPSLRNFSFSLETSEIVLTFSETIDSATFDPLQIMLQSGQFTPYHKLHTYWWLFQ